jgi:hypothetical protein
MWERWGIETAPLTSLFREMLPTQPPDCRPAPPSANCRVSESASQAAGLPIENLERRALDLKGKSEPVIVYVMDSESSIRQIA